MPLGLPLGIPFNNTKKYNARNGASPCLDDLLFDSYKLDESNNEMVSKYTKSVPVLSLNGVDNRVLTLNTTAAVYDNLAIEIEIECVTPNLATAYVVDNSPVSNGGYFIRFDYNTSAVTYIFYDENLGANVYSYTVTDFTTIKKIGVLFTNNSISLYINGNMVKTNTFADKKIKLNNDTVEILGSAVEGLSSLFSGCIKRYIRSSTAINSWADFVELKHNSYDCIYTFTEGSNSTIIDHSGNGNDATVGGTLEGIWDNRRILEYKEDTTHLQNIDYVRAKLVDSNCVQTNGINNILLIGAPEKIGNLVEGLNITILFKTTDTIQNGRYSALITKRNGSAAGGWGLVKRDDNMIVFIYYDQDNNSVGYNLTTIITTDQLYNINLTIVNSYIIITINNNIVLNKQIDLTDFDLLYADFVVNGVFYGGSLYLPLKLFKFESSINQVYNKVFDFTYCTNNTCFDQVTGTEYTISGDPVTIEKQDVLHSPLTKGFTISGSEMIPPLHSNPNVDCVSLQPLTNPARNNGHNIAPTRFDFSKYVNYLVEDWHPDDVTGYEGTQIFFRDRKPAYIDRLLMYSEAITDPCRTKTLKYVGISE